MNFSEIREPVDVDRAKSIVNSILNLSYSATVIVDRQTFEIVYMNKLAKEIFGSKVDCLCYEAFCTREVPCQGCNLVSLESGSVVASRYSEILAKNVTWKYSKINWFDDRDVVMATLMEIEDEQDPVTKKLSEKIARSVTIDRSEMDELTHIPGYAKFYVNAEKAIQANKDKEYAIIVFDIDRFKNINDLYGMTKGDDILKYIGEVLMDIFGYNENYARMHSDMFAFYIEYERKIDIIRIIEKIRKKIGTKEKDAEVNTSYGIYLVQDRSVPINLMCDRAMVASRTTKGDVMRFCAFYDEQYREDMIRVSEIERDMVTALEEGQFQMYLQPKFRLDTEELCGAEALARWLHPSKGIIPPSDFIPLFEKNGFILKLDEYMWEEACKTIRNWIDEGKEPIPISVNVSRYHIKHNNLENVLVNMVEKYGIDPKLLHLEITESLFLDEPAKLNRVMEKLRGRGFKLEVDDFGSGFSSLNLIRNISVDTIKIDKDFLDNEIASDKGKIVVNHTIDMAKELRLQVIAEGVETRAHVDFLRKSKCDIAQGYYFAKPMPLSEFDKLGFEN
ncbi:MAG: GGDEF domain-containing phosphodiesterase [Muribaculaceae bacterium]|nr:GGDEF domain-containing phosphodiesterase [Muribaculaceae bacterium]MCM1399594.1 GGDEF domain-containing phosphodiesterase [Clostridium sp.]MCM1460148.1 GGDEF domain-containing phosphodiesterase [Bacteroides sp.]